MGKYIKKFSTDSARVEYEGSNDYIEPYVSLVDGESSVHYNKIETKLVIRYNVATNELTRLYNYYHYYDEYDPSSEYWIRGIDLFDNITIDGTEVSVEDLDLAEGEYQLSVGEHIVKYTLKDSTNIGHESFKDCPNLVSVNIPNSVTNIGYYAFRDCTGLTSVTIPSSVTSIDYLAFSGCRSLRSVTIPNSVTSIDAEVFENCYSLTSVTIGSSVTSIGTFAFYQCISLTSITSLATTAPTIRDDTFKKINTGGTLTVPSGSSGYDVWMGTGDYYLGKYNWTKVEQ